MASSKLLLIILFGSVLHFCQFNLCFSEDGFGFQFNCYNYQNFNSGSIYGTNLDRLFSQLSTVDFNYGFYNFSVGMSPDKISLTGLCRPDQLEDTCNSCLKDIISKLNHSCPNNIAAVGWLEKCAVHYSNEEIFGVMSTEPSINGSSNTPWTPSKFNQTVTLLSKLSNLAAEGNNIRKYAGGNVTVGVDESAYALVQCTPDLSQADCSSCLTTAIGKALKGSCNGTTGCRVLQPSCNLRYERNAFFEDVPDVIETSPSPLSPFSPPLVNGRDGNGVSSGHTFITFSEGKRLQLILILLNLVVPIVIL